MEGLTEDFRRGVAGSIYTYEGPLGQPADYSKALQFLSIYDDNNLAAPKKYQREAAMATFTATTTRPYSAKTFRKVFADGVRSANSVTSTRQVDTHTLQNVKSKRRATTGDNQPFAGNINFDSTSRTYARSPRRCGAGGVGRLHTRNSIAELNLIVTMWSTQLATHQTLSLRASGPTKIKAGFVKKNLFLFLCRIRPTSSGAHSLSVWDWLLDGGSTCFVCAYPSEYSPYLFNRRPVDLTLVVVDNTDWNARRWQTWWPGYDRRMVTPSWVGSLVSA